MESSPANTNEHYPLGVCASKEHIFLFYYHAQSSQSTFQIDSSRDGINFNHHHKSAQIRNIKKRRVNLKNCRDFRIAYFDKNYFLTYKKQVRKEAQLFGAFSENLIRWENSSKIDAISETAVVVPNYAYENSSIMYFGDNSIKIAFGKNFTNWATGDTVLKSEENFYGDLKIKVGTAFLVDQGILLFYYIHQGQKDSEQWSLNAAVFDKNNPAKLISMYDKPVWESDKSWTNKNINPIGIVDIHGQLISYWDWGTNGVRAVIHPLIEKWTLHKKQFTSYLLKKIHNNPIIKPIVDHFWESRATFNPAAVYDKGRVHIIYRAIGDKDVSVLGYAQSRDGINIDYRHTHPIYVPTQPFESNAPYEHAPLYSPYASGGGCSGGCEDPRITKIDGRFYMSYVAYNGWSHPRIALTSINAQDFHNQKWNWTPPTLISPPGVVDKNACILPEKINDKYIIFHRIFPNILIDYVDSLNFDGHTWLKGEYKITPRRDYWDSRKIGVGAPPIKTPFGWLLLYQAVGDQDPSRYKIGAMLLDKNDPTQILHRTNKPILEPYEWYENEGHKAGVAYPCGAVTLNNQLLVYYGGADTVVCAAHAPLSEFLNHLTTTETAELTPVEKNISIN